MTPTPPAATITTITDAVGSIVTAGVGWISSFIGVIMSNPLILFFVVMAAVGLGIGLIRRLISL